MKKLLIILVIVIVLAGIGIGIGLGRGYGEGDGNSKVEKTQEENESKKDVETEEQSKNKDLVLAITVVENNYFYDNERITLEDFFSEIQEVQEEYIVQVKDDNASLKAYNNLIDELEEQKIDYVEK